MSAKVRGAGFVECPWGGGYCIPTDKASKMRGASGGGGRLCDEFDSCGLEESFNCDDDVCIFREYVMTFQGIQEIR